MIRKKISALQDMIEAFPEEIPDMVVVQRVIGDLALLAVFHEIEIAQDAELVGDRRLGLAKQMSEIAHAQLVLAEGVEHLRSRGVPKYLESFGELLHNPVRLHYLAHGSDLLLVDAHHFAGIVLFSHCHIALSPYI